MDNDISMAISDLVPDGLTPNAASQQERKSSEMRETILEATLDCLANHGYANTTNNLICEIAGVSRGAMLHHYPTRQDMMVAATEYAFYKHMSAFSRAVRRLTASDRMDRNSAIAIDWQLCQTREFQAYLELRVASRTDSELRNIFLPRARHHDVVWKEELLKVFPEWRNDMRKLDLTRRFIRSVLEGMTMSRDLWKDPRTEWALLGFLADVVLKVRNDELSFPSEEGLEIFKKPALLATAKRVRESKLKTKSKTRPKA